MSICKLIKNYSKLVNEDFNDIKLYYEHVVNCYNNFHPYNKEDKLNGLDTVTVKNYVNKYFHLNYGKDFYVKGD